MISELSTFLVIAAKYLNIQATFSLENKSCLLRSRFYKMEKLFYVHDIQVLSISVHLVWYMASLIIHRLEVFCHSFTSVKPHTCMFSVSFDKCQTNDWLSVFLDSLWLQSAACR